MKIGNLNYKLKKLAKTIVTGKKTVDDYDWQFYADLIKEGIKDVSKQHTFVLKPGNYRLVGERLERKSDILPLHPNYHVVYGTGCRI